MNLRILATLRILGHAPRTQPNRAPKRRKIAERVHKVSECINLMYAFGERFRLKKFPDPIHDMADQIIVVYGGELHPSRERVFVVHEARYVQADASDGSRAANSQSDTVPCR